MLGTTLACFFFFFYFLSPFLHLVNLSKMNDIHDVDVVL